jgi:hypothetical protein
VNLENLTGLLQNLRSSVRKKHGKKKLQKCSCRHVPRKRRRRRRRRKLNTSVRRDLQVTFPREQTKIVRNLLRTASWTADPRARLYETGTRQHSLENTCLIVFFTSTKKIKNSRPLPRKKNNSNKETITKSIVVVYKRLKAEKRWDIFPP